MIVNKSEVICVLCHLVLEDPITLPCDCLCCGSHTSDHFTLNKLIRCTNCDREFQVTNDGFRSNKNAKRALDEESYLSDYEKSIKKQIQERFLQFRQSLNEFTTNHANFECNNHEHFIEVRRRVDIHREEAKNKIDEIALKMIDELKQKEIEYHRTLSEYHANITEPNDYENEVHLLIAEFRKETIAIEKIDAMMLERQNKIKKIEYNIKKFKDAISEVESIQFKKNKDFSDELFGELSYNPSIPKIITCSTDNTIRIYEIGSNKTILLDNVSALVGNSLCLEALSGKEFISGANDRKLKIWNVRTGACTKTLDNVCVGQIICLKVITEDLVAVGSLKSIHIWNVKDGICTKILEGHGSWIRCLTTLASGELVSASQDKTIKVWNVTDGICVKNFDRVASVDVNCIHAINGVLASGAGKTIILWSVQNLLDPVRMRIGLLYGHQGTVFSLNSTKEGYLVSSGGDRVIKIWNLLTNECLNTIGYAHLAGIRHVKVLSNGYLVSCASDKTIRTWKWSEAGWSDAGWIEARFSMVSQHTTGHSKLITGMAII